MCRVVAFELKPRVVASAAFENELDILEGIAEDEVLAAFEIRPLPVVLELLEAVQHREEPEIHRAHVEARNLRLELVRWGEALGDRHGCRAAARQVDDDIRALLDARQ